MIATEQDNNTLSNTVAFEVQMMCEVAQEREGEPFMATLYRVESRFWDDDPNPDVVEVEVCEKALACALPAVFAAVDEWLLAGHRLRVPAHTWRSGNTGSGTGLTALLVGRAMPVQAVRAVVDSAM